MLEAFVSCLNFGISANQTSWGNALTNAQSALGLATGGVPSSRSPVVNDRDGDQLHRRRSPWRAGSEDKAMTAPEIPEIPEI